MSSACRGQPGVVMSGMVSFAVPQWMLDKMKLQMQALRTDGPARPAKQKPPPVQTNSKTPSQVSARNVLR